MTRTPSILLVEDDESTAACLALYLKREGYAVTVCRDGAAGLSEALTGAHDLMILDLMLPGLYGLDVCRRLRVQSDMPVIMLTARTLEEDQIRGLDIGADDYVTKPFSPRQVMARVRRALRRRELATEGPVTAGDIKVDLADARATVSGSEIPLTPTELRVLHLLLRGRGRLLRREEIIAQAFGADFDGFDRAVDVHVKNLRRKLRGAETRIETVFGLGYRLRLPESG